LSRAQNQLKTAQQLLERYRAGEPFHLYLKRYFSENKKHGSSDRKVLRDLCYSFFRIGHLWSELAFEDRILSAYYVVHPAPMTFLQTLRPDWETPTSDDPVIRAKAIGRALPVQSIFTYGGACSADIDVEPFVLSHLKQPDLFIRIRPGREKKVIDRLQADRIPFQQVSPDSIALGNSTSLESRFDLDEEVVVQDLSSQRISDLFSLLPDRATWKVWDACAASGGKSILLFDHLPQIDLLCTDVRPSILRNLSTRLGRAGVPVRQIKSDDLSVNRDRSDYGSFDLIVADVPCSGSGTWARTPEQISQFDERSIEDYSILQRKILSNLIPQLAPNGYLLYLTCSVFAQENEEKVNYLMQKHSLISVEKRMIKGYLHRADSMFAALFQRSA